MTDIRKPRHIRDIAHLYISRLKQKEWTEAKNVLVAGSNRSCFPGCHTANLAAGFTSIGFSVRVVELSGLWPCTSHFLSLPARTYMKYKKHQYDEEIAALGGLTIRYSVPDKTETPGTWDSQEHTGRSPAGFINVYHFPPFEDREKLAESSARVLAAVVQADGVLLLAADQREAAAAWEGTGQLWGSARRKTLLLCRGGYRRVQTESARDGHEPAYLSNWRRLLSDNLPSVLRAPDSYASRTYISVCKELVSPALLERGTNDVKRSSQPAAAGPAW